MCSGSLSMNLWTCSREGRGGAEAGTLPLIWTAEGESDQSHGTLKISGLTVAKEAGLHLHNHPNTGTVCSLVNKWGIHWRAGSTGAPISTDLRVEQWEGTVKKAAAYSHGSSILHTASRLRGWMKSPLHTVSHFWYQLFRRIESRHCMEIQFCLLR